MTKAKAKKPSAKDTAIEYGVVAALGLVLAGIIGAVSLFVSFFLLDGMWAQGLMVLTFVAVMALKVKVHLADRRRRKKNDAKWMKA